MSKEALIPGVRQWYTEVYEANSIAARCNHEHLTEQQKALFASLAQETKSRYLGSGFSIPENIQGKRVLDIGCGSGTLVFMLSKLVGPTGYVIGVDLNDKVIQIAKEQSDYHCKQWGYDKPNFEFRVLNAEHLDQGNFRDGEFDVIVSNGAVCLIPDKDRLFRATYKLLKPGGPFYLNDIFADKDAPEKQRYDVNLWSLGTTGAMVWGRLSSVAGAAGFTTPYLTWLAPKVIADKELNTRLENARYVCAGCRLFKLDPSRVKAVNKGPALVTYNGGITDYPDAFPWDVDLTFKKGEGVEVDEELATLLSSIYLSDCFSFKAASGHPVTSRAQDPFELMDKLEAEGKLPEPICTH